MRDWFRRRKEEEKRPAPMLAPRISPAEARDSALASVLLRQPAVDALAMIGATVQWHGARGVVRIGEAEVMVHSGAGAYPADAIPEGRAVPGLEMGTGFLAVGRRVRGQGLAARRASPAGHPDPLGPTGTVLAATALVRALLQSDAATGVVLHTAGDAAVDPASWLQRAAGGPRPFPAWVDMDVVDGELRTVGMEALDLPEVATAMESPEAFPRARMLLLIACTAMVEQNRVLADGEALRLPDAVLRVSGDGELIRVEAEPLPVSAEPPHELWEAHAAAGTMPYLSYRQMLLAWLQERGWVVHAALDFTQAPPGLPPHEVFVLEKEEWYLTITCGIGCQPQLGGTDQDGTAHLELVVELRGHSPALAHTLSVLGRIVHGRGPASDPLGAGLGLMTEDPIPPLGIGGVALDWYERIFPEAGPPISLLTPVVLEESDEIPPGAVAEWLHGPGATEAVRGRWLARIEALSPPPE